MSTFRLMRRVSETPDKISDAIAVAVRENDAARLKMAAEVRQELEAEDRARR